MGQRNFLVEGVSGTGKTAVCHELRRRGYDAVNDDTDLAYQGDPVTGEPTTDGPDHEQHIWDVDRVRELVDDHTHPLTFFCGGSRNFARFIDLFDGVFVLDVDRETLVRRLAGRPADEFGGRPDELDLVLRVHATQEDVPRDGLRIGATAPLDRVVDELLTRAGAGQ